MLTIGDAGHFFNLSQALAEAEQGTRDMCANFGPEVYRGDMLILRMVDTLHWGLSFDEQLEAIQQAFNKAVEEMGKKLLPIFERMAEAFSMKQ